MIKSLLTISVISGIIFTLFSYGDIFSIIIMIKGYWIFLIGIVLSQEAIFLVQGYITFTIVRKFLHLL